MGIMWLGMMWIAGMVALAAPGVEFVPVGTMTSFDVGLDVRRDGQWLLQDRVIGDLDLAIELQALHGAQPDLRVVVSGDVGAPHERVMAAVDAAVAAAAGRVALEMGEGGDAGVDPLAPTGLDSAVDLDDGPSRSQQREMAPRRNKLPPDPYAHTEFTAYTLEPGEVKLGLSWIQVGVLPRLQVSTSPVADLLGIYNMQVKGNIARLGKLQIAATGSGSVVPVSSLLQRLDLDGSLKIGGQKVKGEDLFVRSLSFFGLGFTSSVDVTKHWSVHAGGGWTRATGRGNFDFQNLPVVVIPGLDPVGGDLTVVSSVVAEMFEARIATDIRFNRRDSLILQAATPLYGKARGGVSGDLDGVPDQIKNLDFIVAYGDALPAIAGYRASIAWQFSWQQVDLRMGIGSAAIDGTWWLQAFDLAYRFGGPTRTSERAVRDGWRDTPDEQGPE